MSDWTTTSAPVRELVPPIAGIPVVHEVEDGIVFESPPVPAWAGSAPHEEPIRIVHRVGDTSVDGMTTSLDVPPWSTYYRDEMGRVSIRFHARRPDLPDQLVRTLRPGYEYVAHYAFAPEAPVLRRDKEMAVYAVALASRGRGVLAHACGFQLPGGAGALCPAVSGTGKSTLGRMMQRHDPPLHVVNDDRVVLTAEPAGLRIWSSPWPGNAGIAVAGEAPLSVVAFLRHGTEPDRRDIGAGEAMRRLMRTLALPMWDRSLVDGSLALVERVLTEVPLVELSYPPTPAAARWIVRTLTEVTNNG